MKFYALIAAMLLSGSIAFAQTDPPVMTIGGHPVSRSEFEYFCHKNLSGGDADKKAISKFTDSFIEYKLKVQAAKDAQLDTLPYIKRWSMGSCAEVATPVAPAKGSVRVAHILLRLRQKAPRQEQDVAKQRIDSIYQALLKGADFAEMARRYSDDKASARLGGTLAWIGKGQTVKSFETVAFSLGKGEMSKPFLSEFGYHIVKMLGKEGDGDAALLSDGVADATDAQRDFLALEFYEGALVHEICYREVWSKVPADGQAIAAFYAKNKKKYQWELKQLKKQKASLPHKGEYPAAVMADYQDSLEKQWVNQLRRKYKVVVYRNVMATVKIH